MRGHGEVGGKDGSRLAFPGNGTLNKAAPRETGQGGGQLVNPHTRTPFLSVCDFRLSQELASSAVTPEWVQPRGLHGGMRIPLQSQCTGRVRVRSLHRVLARELAQAYLQSQPRPLGSPLCTWGLEASVGGEGAGGNVRMLFPSLTQD